MKLQIFTTGGTIDKVYFDALSEFQVGDSAVDSILKEANVGFDYEITQLMRKDSLDLTDADRAEICDAVRNCSAEAVLLTHGTDTMAVTARLLSDVTDKTVVFTGSMQPARLRSTDAVFNVGFAAAGAFSLPAGAYVAMNGRFFDPAHVTKNRDAQAFEDK